jgi:hypothetical protein
MFRNRQMTRRSQAQARLLGTLKLPDDVALSVDLDPVNLA